MKLRLLTFLFVLLLSFNSFAFKFSPMSATINIKNKDHSSLFYLENDSNQPIAIQVSAAVRTMDINGVETNTKILGTELAIFPSQVIIPANEKRSVKITWPGKEGLDNEIAYRVIAEQLPIDLEKGKNKKASIKVLLRYMAALYISNEDLSSDVKLLSMKKVENKLAFEFENSGKKHQVLANLHLKITDEKKKKGIELTPDELKGITGENILPQSKRIFFLPREGKLADVDLSSKLKISFEKD
jgi:fimbrial chaperone protein